MTSGDDRCPTRDGSGFVTRKDYRVTVESNNSSALRVGCGGLHCGAGARAKRLVVLNAAFGSSATLNSLIVCVPDP